MSVQLIERNGKPEWAVLPYEEYLRLVEQAEMLNDIQDFDQITAEVERGEEEVIPTYCPWLLSASVTETLISFRPRVTLRVTVSPGE